MSWRPYTSWTVAFVEPRYSINVGYVARVMANFGLSKLVLVAERGDKLRSATARRYASHGSWILDAARVVPSLGSLRSDAGFLVATTARVPDSPAEVVRRPISPEELMDLAGGREDVVIVLGRDTTGLTNEEIAECDFVLHLRTWTDYPTLNVSHALAIILYEVARIHHLREGGGLRGPSGPTAEELSAFGGIISELLRALGYRDARARKVEILMRRLARRGDGDEVRALMGIMRRALALARPPADPGPDVARASPH
jgi:tRNA/rRNA methyltransferase